MFYSFQDINTKHSFKFNQNACYRIVSGSSISSLVMLVNLIQYRGKVGMFNNHRIASNKLNYS